MIRYFFAFLILLHGLIHLMGFAKAFSYGNITQLTKYISKPMGLLWLLTSLLFITAIVLFLFNKGSWPIVAIVAVVLSQILIISSWKDAKFGSIANLVVILVAIPAWASRHFESQFRNDVKSHLRQTFETPGGLLTEADIQSLPQPVQKYLKFSGVINKPRVKNMRIIFDGEMRSKGKDWFAFQSVQYNFFDDPTRLFFMKARMFGMVVPGYHDYQNKTARMNVKLFGLFPVMQAKGPEMNKAETVTVFNDMCLMAPATLIDKRIQWEPIDSVSAKEYFSNGINKISAILYFNEKGELVNFISDDRYVIDEKKQYRFSTPVKEYKVINGMNVMAYGEAVWHYPDGEFVYGKFTLKSIDYNLDDYK